MSFFKPIVFPTEQHTQPALGAQRHAFATHLELEVKCALRFFRRLEVLFENFICGLEKKRSQGKKKEVRARDKSVVEKKSDRHKELSDDTSLQHITSMGAPYSSAGLHRPFA